MTAECIDVIHRVPSSPRCSLMAKSSKTCGVHCKQNPLFGPFVDETVTILLDRILYYMGYDDNTKCSKVANKVTICETKCESICSTTCSSTHLISEECKSTTSAYNTANSGKCKPIICANCKLKTSCVETRPAIRPASCRHCKPSKNVNLLKRSFSLCSLACRQFRSKLFGAPKYCSPRWLWTKEQSYINGCQIYEVFKNSCIKSHPNVFDHDAAARIILVILPSGIIMPFETVSCH